MTTLEKYEKEAKTEEMRRLMRRGLRIKKGDMRIDVRIMDQTGQYTEAEYERAQRLKRRRRR